MQSDSPACRSVVYGRGDYCARAIGCHLSSLAFLLTRRAALCRWWNVTKKPDGSFMLGNSDKAFELAGRTLREQGPFDGEFQDRTREMRVLHVRMWAGVPGGDGPARDVRPGGASTSCLNACGVWSGWRPSSRGRLTHRFALLLAGVMGFSQGGAMASIVAGLQRRGTHFQDVPRFKFCICFAGIRCVGGWGNGAVYTRIRGLADGLCSWRIWQAIAPMDAPSNATGNRAAGLKLPSITSQSVPCSGLEFDLQSADQGAG